MGTLLSGHPSYGVNAPAVPFSKDLPAYLRITDISEDGYFIQGKKASVDIIPTEDNYLAEGDIALARTGASVGKSYRYRKEDGRLVFAGFLIRVRPNKKKLNSIFLFNFLSTENYLEWVVVTSSRSGQPGINGKEYASLPVPIPTHNDALAEQTRIADCLSSLDSLMAAQTQKLDALRSHKRGLMQQLFPTEGESTPRLRFPEFEDAGDWEEKRISDLKPFVTSGSRGWAAYYSASGDLFVRITNLTRSSIYPNLSDPKYVNLPQEASEGVRTQLMEHDVLVSITADIGIIGYIDNNFPTPAYINQHIALIRFKSSQVSGKFISYFLASDKSQRSFDTSTDSGTKAGMNLTTIQSIQIPLPTLPEQTRIADCLASLDALIAAHSDKRAELKTFKRGLMQQLFPVPVEGEE
ncbi:restriction endonuclease subunit S [Deinococcus frigens]|uniref:restriction endonuclease subunit S n=1 Tax=Deinococcus frigens TaxID=249403 RepID=UPI0039F0BF78